MIVCVRPSNPIIQRSEVFLFADCCPERADDVMAGFFCELVHKKKHADTASETESQSVKSVLLVFVHSLTKEFTGRLGFLGIYRSYLIQSIVVKTRFFLKNTPVPFVFRRK